MPRAIAKTRTIYGRTFPVRRHTPMNPRAIEALKQRFRAKLKPYVKPKKRPPTTPYIPPQIHHRPPPTKIALTKTYASRRPTGLRIHPSRTINKNIPRNIRAIKRGSTQAMIARINRDKIIGMWKRGKISMNMALRAIGKYKNKYTINKAKFPIHRFKYYR